MNRTFYKRFLGLLYMAVRRDRPFTPQQRETLVRIVMLLAQDRDACIAIRAARVIIEMDRVNLLLSRQQTKPRSGCTRRSNAKHVGRARCVANDR